MDSTIFVQDFHFIVIEENDSFSSCLKIIDKGGYQLALVVDGLNRFVGLVTDSDVRKSLLRQIELDQPVRNIMNKNPLVVHPGLSDIESYRLMSINHFLHLPVVDDNGFLLGFHVASQLATSPVRDETMVIIAGGRGQRLMPLTQETPKPMLLLNGVPILQRIIEKAKSQGFVNFIISVNYLAEKITDYFCDGSSFGVNISYVYEGAPLGTAGSLSLLDQAHLSDYFVVSNSDLITDASYSDMVDRAITLQTSGLMATRQHKWQSPFGVVHTDGDVLLGLEEKPFVTSQVNAGIYVLSKRLIALLDRGVRCDMTDLFSMAIDSSLPVHAYPLYERWIDIGRMDDFVSAGGKLPAHSEK